MLQQRSRREAQWISRSAASCPATTGSPRFGRRALVALTALTGLLASTASVSGQPASASPDPAASGWRPWVLNSPKELQIAVPAEQAPDLQQLMTWPTSRPQVERISLLGSLVAVTPLERTVDRHLGSQSAWHRPEPLRAFAMMHVAIDDALTAAWDAKYTTNRKRPARLIPRSPLPSLSRPAPPILKGLRWRLGPQRPLSLTSTKMAPVMAAAEEASRSRVLAGVAFSQ